MKTTNILYWLSTGIIALMMLFSAYKYLTDPVVAQGFVHLKFPDWFRIELAIAKLLGALVLIIPQAPARLKEWAYAGFTINFFSAFLAHQQSADPVQNQVMPLVFLVILGISWFCNFRRSVLGGKQTDVATA